MLQFTPLAAIQPLTHTAQQQVQLLKGHGGHLCLSPCAESGALCIVWVTIVIAWTINSDLEPVDYDSCGSFLSLW